MKLLTNKEYAALLRVVECAAPFESLKNSRSHCADAYHIAADPRGKTSIGQKLTDALREYRRQKKI